ncbi:MAG: 4Fe-4S binding protein, partial [Chitinivibrionales bacterium]|nr:4Fe-4S binding protein [Chitinivibrionales bacterium]
QRTIIKINEEKCTGCALCIPNCPEGAIQIIDGKARLVSELMCDGLGACLGHCPVNAISIEKREALEYDENLVMDAIVKAGENTLCAHLKHLKEHKQDRYYADALAYLKRHDIIVPDSTATNKEEQSTTTLRYHHQGGCPGSQSRSFVPRADDIEAQDHQSPSYLSHWPIQLHLISPSADHYKDSDLVLAADCTAFTHGNFHPEFLRGKTLAIACPKLDDGKEIYQERIAALIDEAHISTLTVVIMQVPCCKGLLRIAQSALQRAQRKIPLKCAVIGLHGDIVSRE